MMKYPLLQVVLPLLICAAVGCVAAEQQSLKHQCAHDRIAKHFSPPVAVVREVPKKGQGAWQAYTAATTTEDENWRPLRINVSTENLNDRLKYCTQKSARSRDFLRGVYRFCDFSDILTETKKKTLTDKVLPEAIKLHTDRLLVRRVDVPWNAPIFEHNSACFEFIKPSEGVMPDFVGVRDVDFLLYVASGATEQWDPPAWGIACALDRETERPLIGALHVKANMIEFEKGFVRFIAHELGHALGFDYERMLDRRTIATKKIRGNLRIVFDPTNTLREAKEHYKCNTMKGMELHKAEDNNELTSSSHWMQRYAKDELMSITEYSGVYENIGYYTALTIAAFEDLGYYKGNFSMAEPMSWGLNAGCDLVNEVSKGVLHKKYPNMFCKYNNRFACSSNRMGLGTCSGTGSTTADIHVVAPNPFLVCSQGNGFAMNGLLGPNSWCLDGDSLMKGGTNGDGNVLVDGLCGEVKCDNGIVEMRFDKNFEWTQCYDDDKTVTPKMPDSFKYVSGGFKCPKYSEVCTVGSNGSSLITVNIKKAKKRPRREAAKTTTTTDTTTSNSIISSRSESSSSAEGVSASSKGTKGKRQRRHTESAQDSKQITPSRTDSKGDTGTTPSADGNTGKVSKAPEGGVVDKTNSLSPDPKNKENTTPSNQKEKGPITGGVTTLNVNNAQVNISMMDNADSLTARVFTPFLLLVLVLWTVSIFP